MNLDIIARLVRILSESPELGAIEVRRGWFGGWSSIRVTKAGHGTNAGGGGAGGEQQVAVAQAPAPPLGAGAPGSPAAPGAPPKTQLVEIKSPMVGTFYSKPAPDKADYVKAGSKVKPDSIVCKLEAMKLFNDLPAECTGAIAEVCVKNGQAVDFGTVLFRVELH